MNDIGEQQSELVVERRRDARGILAFYDSKTRFHATAVCAIGNVFSVFESVEQLLHE